MSHMSRERKDGFNFIGVNHLHAEAPLSKTKPMQAEMTSPAAR